MPDNGSGQPDLSGATLETIIAQTLPADKGIPTRSTVVRSVAKPGLTGGMTYWIIVTTAAYDGNLYWCQSDSVTQTVSYTADGGQTFKGYTTRQAAFDV